MYTENKKYLPPPDAPQPFWIECCGTSWCDYSYRMVRTLQQADVYVVEYVIAGTGTIRVNSKEYHPSAGDFYLLQPGMPHEYFSSAEDPWIKVFANLYGTFCSSVIDAYGLSNTVLVKNCNLRKSFDDFINIANSQEKTIQQIIAQCAAKFVEIIVSASYQVGYNSGTGNEEANRLCSFLNANTQRIVHISELAGLIYRSPDYTIKLFKRVFGCTPYNYQLHQKIAICKRRLCSGNDSISDIAYDLGYGDSQYFSKLFRSRCGESPSQYRERFLQKNCDDK